jgi:hypothetical protein
VDKKQIRTGDLFVEALEGGLESSRCLGLVATTGSVNSGWCKEECYRALSLSKTFHINVIPLIFDSVRLPGFLANRQHIDFRSDEFEANVEALIWPGITGQSLAVVFTELEMDPWEGDLGGDWRSLYGIIASAGVEKHAYHEGGVQDRDILEMAASGRRLLNLVAPFGYWPWEVLEAKEVKRRVERLLNLREITKNTASEVVFGFYMHPDALARAPHDLDDATVARLAKYFTIPMTFHDKKGAGAATNAQRSKLTKHWQKLWFQTQLYCTKTERDFWGCDIEARN